jgi:hypothetical protein
MLIEFIFPRYVLEERIDFVRGISRKTLGGWNGKP